MSSKCVECQKPVYMAEEVKIEGRSWHRVGCFKCTDCKTMLEKGKQLVRKDDPQHLPNGRIKHQCQGCFNKRYGPKGYGFGGAMGGNYGGKPE